MTEQRDALDGTRFLVIAAALVIIVYGVNQAQTFVSLFLVSLFLALLGTPPVLWLERKRVPSFLSVVIVMGAMVTFLLAVGGVVGSSLNTLSNTLPMYESRLHEQVLGLKDLLATRNIDVTEKALFEYLNPGTVMSLLGGLFTGLGSVLSNIILILLTVTFILLEASSFPVKLRAVLGDPKRAFPQFTKFVGDIRRFMIIKTIISLVVGVLIGLWLFILGVDFPILWGFLAFLLNFVPNVGQIFAAIPAVILALLQLGPGTAALAAAGYAVIGFTLGNAVEPRIMGRNLGLSTLVVFLSLLFWGNLLGPIGVILCIPLTMTLKFAFENNPSTRWIGILLGSEQPAESSRESSKRQTHPDT
jgi:predicted PurR-regulated permease PerM